MNVLVACEFSGVVREAFRAKGHKAYSCDILPADDNQQYHLECDVLDVLDGYNGFKWDLMIAFPPCTYLTNAGVRHLYDNVTSKNGVRAKVYGKERMQEMVKAAYFFNMLFNAPIKKICVENPIPHGYAKQIIGQYTQLIQPWQFGHKETKATCLWLKNLPKLVPTKIVGPPPKNMTPAEKREWHKVHYASPGKDRWKKRSVTYSGIARAMADAWG